MTTILLIKISVLVLLLLCSGFFSSAETSLFSFGRVERYRIGQEQQQSLALRWIHELIQQPRRLVVSILIGNELINITIASLGASLADEALMRGWGTSSPGELFLKSLTATAILYPILILFGEIIPKTLALRNPPRFAHGVAIPLRLFSKAVTPVRWVLEGLANSLVHLTLGERPSPETPMTEDEFRALVDLSKEGGALWESEREFIHNIFDFGETRVSELMTPRTDTYCLQIDQPKEEVLEAIETHHYSRIPVYEKDKDDIVGLLYSKDLLSETLNAEGRKGWNLRSVLRKAYFIPQTKKATDLFREFRSNRVHMAIVVDEYGGVAGLVTMEDLLEDLFGEILDEYDPEEPVMRRLDGDTVIIPARMSIEEFNRRLDAQLPEDEYETMGGLVFDLFGRLPSPGSRVSFMRYTYTVEKMLGTRILEVRVHREAEGAEPGDASRVAASGTPGGKGGAG